MHTFRLWQLVRKTGGTRSLGIIGLIVGFSYASGRKTTLLIKAATTINGDSGSPITPGQTFEGVPEQWEPIIYDGAEPCDWEDFKFLPECLRNRR